MSQRKNDLSENIYMSFYRPKIGADGIWELPLVLETVSEANGTTIPLPLPYRKLNAEVLEYLEDVAQQMPKGEEARIVVYLPMEQIQPGLEQKLNKVIDIYGDVRLARLKREEKRALRAALSALAWGLHSCLSARSSESLLISRNIRRSRIRFPRASWYWVGWRSGNRSKRCCSIGVRRCREESFTSAWRRCRWCCGRCRRHSRAD